MIRGSARILSSAFSLSPAGETSSPEMPDRGDLVEFHSKHKLLILAHSTKHYQEMGRLVARVKQMPLQKRFRTSIRCC